jgi:hypothetical protein
MIILLSPTSKHNGIIVWQKIKTIISTRILFESETVGTTSKFGRIATVAR